jgi:hypothetical protein
LELFIYTRGDMPKSRQLSKVKKLRKVLILGSGALKIGKAGGFRSYIYLYQRKSLLVPLCVYAKSQTESITENELKHHLDETILEILLNSAK